MKKQNKTVRYLKKKQKKNHLLCVPHKKDLENVKESKWWHFYFIFDEQQNPIKPQENL